MFWNVPQWCFSPPFWASQQASRLHICALHAEQPWVCMVGVVTALPAYAHSGQGWGWGGLQAQALAATPGWLIPGAVGRWSLRSRPFLAWHPGKEGGDQVCLPHPGQPLSLGPLPQAQPAGSCSPIPPGSPSLSLASLPGSVVCRAGGVGRRRTSLPSF